MKQFKKALACVAVVALMAANSLTASAEIIDICSSCGGDVYLYRKVLLYTETYHHTVSYIHENDICTVTTSYYDVIGRCSSCNTIAWHHQEQDGPHHTLPHN